MRALTAPAEPATPTELSPLDASPPLLHLDEASPEARAAIRARALERAPELGRWTWLRQLLWAAMLATSLFAAVLPVLLGPTDAEPEFATAILMWAVTLAVGVASFVLPKRWLYQAIDSIDPVVREDIALAGDYRSTRARRRVVHLDVDALRKLRRVTWTPFVMSIALPTSLSLLGLLLQRLGHETLMCAPMTLVGALLVATRCPTESALALEIAHALDADLEL